MTTPDRRHLIVILDRSGSMNRVREDTEGGLNALLDEQRKTPGVTTVTLVQFDDEIETVYTGRPLDDELSPRSREGRKDRFLTKYLDEENTSLFPFGFGMSYTTFNYSPPSLLPLPVLRERAGERGPSDMVLSATSINAGQQRVKVTATIRNVGDRDGVEIVQLHIRQRGTSVARPVRELKGFQRVALRAGEQKQIEFILGREELAFWNIDMKHVVEPAMLTVWVGPDARSGQRAELTIGE